MPSGVEATIFDALLTRLGTLPAQTPSVDLAMPGLAFTPTPGKTYLQAQILPNTNVNAFLANDSTTEFRGIFQVAVMAPSNQGIIKANEIAGAIVDHFERGSPISGAGIRVRIEGRPSIAPYLQEPDRLRVPVSVRYSAFA